MKSKTKPKSKPKSKATKNVDNSTASENRSAAECDKCLNLKNSIYIACKYKSLTITRTK